MTKEKLEEVLKAMGQMLFVNEQGKQHIIPRQVDAWRPMWVTWTNGLRKIHFQQPGQTEASRAIVLKVLQEVSINAEIYFIAKGYTPKPGKFPVIPKDDREVRSLIQQKFSGEDRVFEVDERKMRQPPPTIIKYIGLIKRVFEQNSISHERYAKCLFNCAIVTGIVAVVMER